MEVIDIGLGSDLPSVSLNLKDDFNISDLGTPSASNGVNFGPGIELLMNDKKRSSTNNIHIDLGDVDKLESDLNALSGNGGSSSGNRSVNFDLPNTNAGSVSGGGETKTLGGFSNLFGFGSNNAASSTGAKPDSGLGQATAGSMGNAKTWDGFSKMNEIPTGDYNASSKLSEREKRRKKRLMLKKLEEWYEKGTIKNNTHYSMDSSYEEIEDEYETALEDKRKKDSIKLQGWWFMTFVNSIEYANSAFNPFDLNLDGWGEQVSEDIDSYEEIFGELHEKYKGGKLAPELSLLLRLGFSACMVNFTNKALSTATPAFSDVIKQSPELMKMFTNATAQSMSQQMPGASFMSNMLNKPEQINTSFGPPPKPVDTKSQPVPVRQSMQFTETPAANRPDISMGRGTMFRQEGVDVNTGYSDVNRQEKSLRPPARAEMRGPQTDIDSILSGLKTKAVNIHESAASAPPKGSIETVHLTEDDSMISISSLGKLGNATIPKRSNNRKTRSDKNVVSLDI